MEKVKKVRSISAMCLAAVMAFMAVTLTSPVQVAAQEFFGGMPPLIVYRTTANLRLRTEPSTQSSIITTVPRGTQVQVLSFRDGEWFAVNVNGLEGYMYSGFLTFVSVRAYGSPMYIAGSVTIMDVKTGQVFYESDQHTLRYPASITKIMTALLVLERTNDLSDEVTFSRTAVSIPSYASRMGMRAGDTLTVYDALYGLLLTSGNEVANALAEHVSGSIEEFVELMNQRATFLGATNTRFLNPSGLPGPGQHTTSFDMALIMREAIRHPVFNRIIATPSTYIASTGSNPNSRTIRNLNRLIQNGPDFNEWVVGGKTGFTGAARHTIVTYSQNDGRSLIVSLLYVPQRSTIFSETTALLEFAFSKLY